jgi:hypothetical protein
MVFKSGIRLDPAGAGDSPVSAGCRPGGKRMKAIVKGTTAISPTSNRA